MEPMTVPVTQTKTPKTPKPPVDIKQMFQWHGRIVAIREEIDSINKKIPDIQKNIDAMSAKLGNVDIDEKSTKKHLDKKIEFIQQKTQLQQRIEGLRAEKKELLPQLDSAKKRKSKELRKDAKEVEKVLVGEKQKLEESEKMLKTLESEASKSEDSKILLDVRNRIKSQRDIVQANRKEITELEGRKQKLIIETYAFSRTPTVKFFDPSLKGKKFKPHFISQTITENGIDAHCFVPYQKNCLYVPYIKQVTKNTKYVNVLDPLTKFMRSDYLGKDSYYVKILAVPGETVQDNRDLHIKIDFRKLNITVNSVVFLNIAWDPYVATTPPEV